MNDDSEILAGSSEARERQGGYCPPPPRSCAPHESCDGLPVSSTASETGESVIAGTEARGKEPPLKKEEDILIWKRLYNLYKDMESKYRCLMEKKERNEVGTQVDPSPSSRKKSRNTWTQINDSPERRGDVAIEEIEKRIKRLEDEREVIPKNTERPTVLESDSWSKVVGRREQRKKKGSLLHQREEGPRQKQAADPKRTEETREEEPK